MLLLVITIAVLSAGFAGWAVGRRGRPAPPPPAVLPPAVDDHDARDTADYRDIVENAVEGIFQTSPAGKYLSANRALARLYGYESPRQLTAELADIGGGLYVDPDRRAAFAATGEVANFQSQIYRRDRTVIWISETARAVRGAGGTTRGP